MQAFRFAISGSVLLLVLLSVSCGTRLKDDRAAELVRLNYRQQNTLAGAGTWMLDSVSIASVNKIAADTLPSFQVLGYVSGIYKYPVIEDAPSGLMERFYDTVQFRASLRNKVWMASDFTILGSRHE